jgi:hypothetical protein
MATAKYRYVGDVPGELASGQPIEPGEFVNLSDEDAEEAHNQALLADGKLIGTGDKSKGQAETAEQRVAKQEQKVKNEAAQQAGEEGS